MQDRYNRCPNCMQGLPAMDDVCPYCGFGVAAYEEKSNCLKPFTLLQNKYMIGRVIGVGGFGITYIGWDLNLQTYIAIKEYYPDSLATRDMSSTYTQVLPNESKKDIYDKGLKRYVEEAQNLSKFYQLQGIVSVKDFFYENGTGYIVMEYINGINLKEYLNNAGGRLDEATILALMKPVFESLYQIHNSGLVHRDISPDNIMVDKDNKIKLIDFGSARGQSSETDKTYTVILKHGYAPAEQYYAKGNQGPWTDIYSLCATMYKMLTGQIPPNSVERMEQDEYQNPSAMGVTVSQRTEYVLRKGLAVKVSDRYQHIGELLADLYGSNPIENMNTTAVNAVPYASSGIAGGVVTNTMQSMHLDMGNTNAPAKKSNKLFIGIAVAVVVVLLIIGLVLILDKNDDGGATSTAPTTEATEESSTEPTTEAPEGYVYEAPTAISNNWRDYTISIDGVIYKLPMPYEEFVKCGWNSQQVPTQLAAGEHDTAFFYNDTMEMDVALANFGLTEAPISECFVVGFSIEPGRNDVPESTQIELASGIKWNTSTEDDIKKAYGAPDNRNTGEDGDGNPYTRLDYLDDNDDDGMDFELNADGVLCEINIANTALPKGYEVNSGDVDTAPPEINSYYVPPAGESTDRFDGIITVDGLRVVLPVPVSEFTANGWIVSTDAELYILGNDYIETYLEKDGNKITVQIENFTLDAIRPANGYITCIEVESNYCFYDVAFPGGVTLGGDFSVFENAYSDLGQLFSVDEFGSFIAGSASEYTDEGSTYIYISGEPDTRVIKKIKYEITIDGIEQQ